MLFMIPDFLGKKIQTEIMISGNEGIPTKPYAQQPGGEYPLPGFSLKAQLARNNIVNNNSNIFMSPQVPVKGSLGGMPMNPNMAMNPLYAQ